MRIDITFYAAGYVTQTVEICDPAYTPERLVEELNSGELLTTVQEHGTGVVAEDDRVVAKILDIENNLEYSQFEQVTETQPIAP